MKISMFMLLAGAAIIFAAPLANAREVVTEHEVITEHSFIPHKAVKHVKHVKTASGKTSGATKTSPRPPLYIYVPPFSGSPTVAAGTDWCVDYMVDCSDQQLCENWGLNCSTAGNDQPAQAPASVGASASETLASTGSGLTEVLSASDTVQSDSSTSTASTNDQDADC